MLFTSVAYGFEYLGCTPSLVRTRVETHPLTPLRYTVWGDAVQQVITPLTMRCWTQMLVSANQCMGTLLTGAACAGKTETVRHLARSAGLACMELNCALGADQLTTNRIFKGIAATGAWCCLDSIDRMLPQVLSVVAQQVQALQRALMVGGRSVRIDGDLVQLAGACSIFATMRPSESVSASLPANLASSLRVCAVSAPDELPIAKVWFWVIGMTACDSLAQKAVAVLRSCRELIARPHHDFGLRKLRSIVDACSRQLPPAALAQRRTLVQAKTLSRSASVLAFDPDEALLLRACQSVLLPMLSDSEELLLKEILVHVFPLLPASFRREPEAELRAKLEELMAAEKLSVVPNQLEKAIQFWHTLCNQRGVMIMGAPATGKSTLLRLLARAVEDLQLQSARTVTIHTLCPKAGDVRDLLGSGGGGSRATHGTHATQPGRAGVLASIVRGSSDLCHADPQRRDWIVCDGPIDPVRSGGKTPSAPALRQRCAGLMPSQRAHPVPAAAGVGRVSEHSPGCQPQALPP